MTVEEWVEKKEVKPFSGSGHIILPKKLVGKTVRVELVDDGDSDN